MTARKADNRKLEDGQKSLSLGKRTLKDLSVRHEGPNGGFIMKDSVIVRTGGFAAGTPVNLGIGG